MNGKKAKAIRKKVYGSNSYRIRKYFVKRHQKNILVDKIKKTIIKFQVFADQLREIYQKLKKEKS